ncbi:MAG: NUDIX hydrolase [Bacteroides sp.]|nr:NUDIX hydrolase [Bacteroides sp.]MCM1446956.1 NUDIX hydrolase [Bacteroides sp.]
MVREDKWKVLESKYISRRPWMTARKDVVQLPDGRINPEYWVLEFPDWVNVIAITRDGGMLMVRQYRHALGVTEYELCAGVVEEGETPLQAARRELMEETGFGGGEWTEYMSICANPSNHTNLAHTFLAVGVDQIGEQHLDDTEELTYHVLSMEDVFGMLQRGEIMQALMAAPLWKYFYERNDIAIGLLDII